VGRVRSADNDHSTRIWCRARIAGLGSSYEQSGTTLSSRTVAAGHAIATHDGLFDFQPTRHHRMHGGRKRLRYRSACRQSAKRRVPDTWRFTMAVCSAGPGYSSKGRNSSRSFLQIVPKTFRRAIITVCHRRSLLCAFGDLLA